MTRREVFPIINCSDLASTCAFYERVFAARRIYRFPEEGEPVYVTLRIGDGQLALGVGTSPALYGATPLPATGHAVDVCLYVEDLAAVVDAAREAEAPVPLPPTPMPWGETVAYVRDPEGTMLLVIQAPAEARPEGRRP
ncbi:glyoxalase/bleomycin resistance/extradiol dioxygenase family protein [Arthrobacter sp. SX1312]|uniref:VOC family protein n=1 Tax=Arthrobacter sp. SX1312 TaxID=2058896 RepID=UPI000CE43FC9|nr:VOC family protein [Arthrobacter sp. SX1312]